MKILVIQLRRLGDVFVTTPAVEALRAAYPQAEIDFLVEPPGDQILEGSPHLTRVVTYDVKHPWAEILKVRAAGYDWVIDFLGTPRSAVLTFFSGAKVKAGPSHVFHRWAYNRKFPAPRPDRFTGVRKLDFILGALGVPAPAKFRTWMTVPDKAKAEAAAFLKSSGVVDGDRVLAVAPFSRRDTRLWPKEYFAQLLRGYLEKVPGSRVLIFWGGKGEGEDARWIQKEVGVSCLLIPDTRDLKLCAALMQRASAALCCDNGFKHMAHSQGVPTLSIYGATQPANWNPPADPRFPYVRRDELFCIGCEKNECPYKLECMTGLTPDRVLPRLLELVHAER